MKLAATTLLAALVLSACQVTPDTNDKTNATMRFRIHYQGPGVTSPYTEIVTTQSTEAGRCLFVANPFGVSANVADQGGVRSISIGASAFFDALRVREQPGDLVAIPSPTNPADLDHPADSALIRVSYATGKAFDSVTLYGTYRFNNATLGALHGTAHNFGSTTGVAEVYNFYVRPATANPNEQPGMECKKP